MNTQRVEGKSYGQRVPPLTSVIKSILERYPDGGQILKEIIQNADDASATKISFLLDSRNNFYGKSSLYNGELAKFQGPALYAFNNALFKQEDWVGLQSLMDSNKKEDPLKVGRFGIGFNSIYHVTDLPSIVSGKLLAFLDPHEEYFGRRETGKQFNLDEPLLQVYHDQFSPYENVLGYKISSQFLNGTLFRFPLRTEPSDLSQKLYTADKVRSLFNSLKEEASLILLFLKNIEEINLYETDGNSKERLIFRVGLHDNCRKRVREERQKLLRLIPEWESGRQEVLELNLEMVFEIFDETLRTTRQDRWITHNRIGDDQSKLRSKAQNLHLLPWIGFAAPLTVEGSRRIGSNGGRIFCFLPLPPDADARTGYPVHIHGYFGLTDNRRGLKWPGSECQNDDMAEWNEDLIKYVGSQAYANLLQAMSSSTSKDMINFFYQCWPNKQHVNKHWKKIIDSIFSHLLGKKVFWTWSCGGRWINLNQAVLERLRCNNLTAKTKEIVKNVLLLANEPIVSLPLHVDEFIRVNATNIRTVTPMYLRAILKKNRQGSWDVENMKKEEKIAMLEYIITDYNFADFEGIELLPLADGRFTSFIAGSQCGPNDVVYVETPDNRMSLLPGMESRFLDPNIACLVNVAADQNNYRQSPLQLVRLNPQTVVSLLWQVIPNELLQSNDPVALNPLNGRHPSEAWIAEIWRWLKQKFAYDLTRLEGLPLIKCSLGMQRALAKLTRNTKVIRQHSSDTGSSLARDFVGLLKTAGIIVLPEVPSYMMEHPRFSLYVANATPEGVLKVLRNVGARKSIAAVMSSNPQEKRSLRAFLCSFRAKLSNDDKMFLRSLPVFEAIDQNSFINAQNKKSTAPNGYSSQISIKIKNASTILSVEDYSSNQLLKILNVPEMTMAQFLMEEIFPHLSWYNVTQITSLMCWVLRRIAIFKSESPYFCSYIMGLIFVDAGHGMLFKPKDLFDPRIGITRRLFEGEKSRFPMGQFASADILVALCSLGLKQKPDPHDLVSLVSNLYNFNCDQRCRKAQAFLEILDDNPSFLTTKVNVLGTSIMLKDYLQSVAWVPCTDGRPAGYPHCMPWKSDGNSLLKPVDVVASQYSIVVGAVMSVLHKEPANLKVKSFFGWNSAPDSSKVLEQLRLACRIDVGELQGNEREDFCRMLKLIYKAIAVKNISDYYACLFQDNFAWVWNGQGFSSPKNIAFERRFNFDLEPYLFTLPKEIQDPELGVFFSTSGVKNCFDEEDVLAVLHQIKIKHGNLQQNKEVVRKDKQLALDILHWIVRDGALDLELRDKVYVPVMKDPDILKLVPLTECTFCDAAWLRGNVLELKMLPELSELSLIDESISNTTAFRLGVPPMSKCVTAPEILGFEKAGPYESITARLKNILDEYKEGAGVFKELIQNADDAGATEVKFLVDWRQHPVQKLLAEGLKETQGPALLAYNNAIFTNNDFKNISKLAGATKKKELDKIGRFGLGFNSVYHLTDTPSFISSHFAVFFDPTTLHLGNFIIDPAHPGIKLDLAKKETLLCYPDQFQPYHGVFDCDVNGETPFNFKGTLFRFPFRRGHSEICDKQYNKYDVDALLQSFNTSASTLLLNTQNVKSVSIWEIDQLAKEPSGMQLLIKVDRTALADTGRLKQTTFLRDCAEWSKTAAISGKCDEELPQRNKIIATYHTKRDGMKTQTDYWLQCDRLGDGESLHMATSEEGRLNGLLSCAGVTAKLSRVDSDSWKIQDSDGEAFCFLPLSIRTGLSVHVNGYFAVTSNRRGIWEQTSDESQSFQPLEARWNKTLMNDGIAKAYLELLKEAAKMAKQGSLKEYKFCSLWPNPDRLQSRVWMPLIIGVYKLISSSSFPLLKSGEEWHSVNDCMFIEDELKRIPGTLEILFKCNIVDLPQFARNGFQYAGCKEQIENHTLTQKKFLVDVFFPHIGKIACVPRDKVVCYIIDECLSSSNNLNKNLFKQLTGDNACIPCSSDPQVLAHPRDLISPNGAAASLYSPSENKMPVGDCFREPKRLLMLEELGMVRDVLNWNQVLDRAKSVQILKYKDGLKRVSNLIEYLNKYIDKMPNPSVKTSNDFASLPILPVMAKPVEYPFDWEGAKHKQRMMPSKKLFCYEYANVIGALKPVLDECESTGCGRLNGKVRDLFQLSGRKPTIEEALTQLRMVCQKHQQFSITLKCQTMRHVGNICSDIYKFLHTFLGKEEENRLIESLQSFPWILVDDRFVKSNQLAFKWRSYGAPYLYRVPLSLANSPLLVAVGVKMEFDKEDFLSALKAMKTEKKDGKLNDSEFKISKAFLDELNARSSSIPKYAIGCTPLPDHEKVLRPARDLVINDAPWVKISDDIKYVHEDISINLAHFLGARDIRSRSLEDISRPIGQPFGQKELLTDRLVGILKSYPCDFGILKDLLQNADDAKATEIHFVYDTRYHSGERVFSESWKELQGPALCVYNDRPFTEKDLEGIQRLGIGSKADSPEKTGQYGIGFNAVYHLTDCPSFITNGNTLCILDPHIRYAPGATKANPGMIIGPLEKHHRENYRDVFPGYLGELFDLQGSTMFRFPLRNKEMARKSLISKQEVLGSIELLLTQFKTEAKQALLFLNHVKKISVSTIKDEKLLRSCEVRADLEEEDEENRRELAARIQKSKYLETREIKKFSITYPIVLKDRWSEEKWIVQQLIGVENNSPNIEIPDGKQNGLLPRGGVAAKVTTEEEINETIFRHTTSDPKKRNSKAFCFLPLPVFTGLPVHVNGHFALDSGRRHLWQDEHQSGFRTKWNNFMKTEVIADAYVNLLLNARNYIPFLKHTGSSCFRTTHEGKLGLEWYQELFPSKYLSETQWEILVAAVLKKIVDKNAPVFPLLQKEDVGEMSNHSCNWLASSNSFFTESNCNPALEDILRSIGFKLISLSHQIYKNFKDVDVNVTQMTPDNVMTFLSANKPLLKQLPCPVTESIIQTTARYFSLLLYCMKSSVFSENLDGVALLLTKDGVLGLFSTGKPVYMSAFSHLVPSPVHFRRFAGQELTKALKPISKKLFEQQSPVVLPFKLPDLVTFLSSIFHEHNPWNQTSIPVVWDPDKEDQKIAKWLVELWHFISVEYEVEPSNYFLEPLQSWPIIPTTSRHLIPVSLSKTVLDLTELVSWSKQQTKIVNALRKLRCPEVDMQLITFKAKNVTPIVQPYLAYPNSVDDVIIVLDNLMKTDVDISGRIKAAEAEFLLQFLQEDSHTLEANIGNATILRKLPFYRTIDGRLINLEGASSVCKVPRGIPLEESSVWMRLTNHVFLDPCHSLDVLHKILGVQLKSQTACYIEFIFPNFNLLNASTRVNHLRYIRDHLFSNPNNEEVPLQKALKNLSFIPNEVTGKLRKASDFYDPTNPVFQALLTKDKFPGMPFSSSEWVSFLRDVGLQQTLSTDQVFSFAKEIERQANSQGVTEQLMERSRILTNYVIQETSLHESNFLQNISSIKFVMAHRVSIKLNSLVKQFSYRPEASISLISFRNAVPQKYEILTWSTVALLPSYFLPCDKVIRDSLGIIEQPTTQNVVMHVNNICGKFSRKTDMDLEAPLRQLLLEIMGQIYQYLQGLCLDHQSLQLLRDMPLVLVENGGIFVQCKQLAFEMNGFEEQPPYLYKVPRNYGIFEDLLKSLGAMERPSPSQYVDILEKIWKSSQGKEMHAEEMRNTKLATTGLFMALRVLQSEDQNVYPKTTKCKDSLKDVKVIYLPSQKRNLKPSNQLFHMYDCPQMLDRVGGVTSRFDLMLELTACGFTNDRPEDLLNNLPRHLQPKSLTEVLREELHSECLDKKCRLDEDRQCSEASRLRDILASQQFTDGIIRILKAQEQKATIKEEVRQKVENLKPMFTIVCFESLETIMKNSSDEEIDGSRRDKSHFICNDEKKCCICIRHGREGFVRNMEICEFIYRQLDGVLNPLYLFKLQAIIRSKKAEQIPHCLDELGIERDVQQSASKMFETKVGSVIPLEEHYLLMQFEDFIFRPNEIVGYEEEDNLDDEQGKYIYARIIEKIISSSQVRETKKKQGKKVKKKHKHTKERDPEERENPLLGRYLIDIGTGSPIEVDVLDLYKIKRPQGIDGMSAPSANLNDHEDTSLNCLSVVPYEGKELPTERPDTAKPSTWEEVIKEVRQALADIMNLPKEKRHKALKRLYLRWHPDKNPNMVQLATKVMQFIQGEFERLSTGRGSSNHGNPASDSTFDRGWYDRFYANCNRRARQQRSTYDNYQRQRFTRNFSSNFRSSWGSRGDSFAQNDVFHAPDATMARIWIIQARADLRSVAHLLAANDCLNWLICFQCSQVVEKALKAALYSVCGMSDNQLLTHDLIWLASELKCVSGAPDVLWLAGELRNYHVPTRYPSKHAPAKPPKDIFTLEDAQKAFDVARNVLRVLEEFIGIVNL